MVANLYLIQMARPLGKICDIANNAGLDLQDAHDVLKIIYAESPEDTRIVEIMDDLRLSIELLSRISVEPRPIQLEDISLKSSIQRILRMTGLANNELEVEINIEDEADKICTSKIEILRIFGNLLKNAYKAIDKDNKKITIEVKLNEAREIEITIADNGPGLPDKIKKSIFEDRRIQECDIPDEKERRSEREHGYGFDSTVLAIELIGGSLTLVKSSNEGTTLKISIPNSMTIEPSFVLSEDAEIALQQSKRIIHDVRNGLAAAGALADEKAGERKFYTYVTSIRQALEDIGKIFKNPEEPSTANKSTDKIDFRAEVMHLLEGKYVIMIDDDPEVRDVMERTLEDKKVDFIILDKPNGLDVCTDLPSDQGLIILLDQSFTDMEGIVRTIKSKYPNAKLVSWSGSDAEDNDGDYASTFVKPYTNKAFYELLQSIYPDSV